MNKSISVFAASTLFALSFAVSAAGPYDGIYQSADDSNQYATLHQTGTSVIVAAFSIGSVSNVTVTGSFGKIGPRSLDTWDLYQGTMNGAQGTMSGETTFRACNRTWSFSFDTAGNINSTLVALSNTASGTAQNVNCSAEMPVGTVAKFNRVF